jgi:hypothetical protein
LKLSARTSYEYWLKNWSDIQDHLPLLYNAAKGQCLEIGVRSGVSTSAILAGLEVNGGHLCSVDLMDCSGVFQGHPQWSFKQGNSRLVDPLPIPAKIDLLFIDGDHSFDGALMDLMHFGHRAEKIFVHDVDNVAEFPGVRQAVEEYSKRNERKVIYHSGSFGMAEL